ncbi:MAG TPA: nucleotidyltransferase family protein [Nitrospinota bacterium]|nr:nucleotidyltransferase family protein [Nitrospinota bacterium]
MGVPVILLKGIVLVETLYEDPGLRPLSDVDIMVRPEDVQKTRTVLIEMGFEPWENFGDHLERGPLVIELHVSFSDTDRIDRRRHTAQLEIEAIWERARPDPTGAPHVFQLALEDHLLYLCRHLLKHSYDSLIWFTDVAAFVRRHEADLNWPLLFDRARENALYPTLIFTLRFLLEHIGEDLPRPIIEEAAAAPRPRLENLILVRLARQLDIGPLANLLLLPTIASFPRDDVMRQIYPSYRKGRRIWFCTLRLFQLIGLGVLTAFRLLIPRRRQRPLRKV